MRRAPNEKFGADVMDAIAAGDKAGLSTKYMAGYLRDAVKALTTPALWVEHRKTLARKGMH